MPLTQIITYPTLASAGIAALYWVGFAARDAESWVKSIAKTLPLVLLCVAALGHMTQAATGFWLVPFGLGLGAFGDLMLSRPGVPAFLAGMAGFAAGHLAYAVAFWPMAVGFTGGVWIAAVGLVALVLSTEAWLAPRTDALRWPVRAYVVVIGLMGLSALALGGGPGRGEILAGAGLFILSDVLLALRLFVWKTGSKARGLSLLLWPAYWLGQALILMGAVSLWPAVAG